MWTRLYLILSVLLPTFTHGAAILHGQVVRSLVMAIIDYWKKLICRLTQISEIIESIFSARNS